MELDIRSDDYPLEYTDFEGIVPEGQYSSVTVILWDKDQYANRTEIIMAEAINQGNLIFT